jgi:hypothetical protein
LHTYNLYYLNKAWIVEKCEEVSKGKEEAAPQPLTASMTGGPDLSLFASKLTQ